MFRRSYLLVLILLVAVTISTPATLLSAPFAESFGSSLSRMVTLTKNARKNGYTTTPERGSIYLEVSNVEDPVTNKLLEGLKKLQFRCAQNDPVNSIPLYFTAGRAPRFKVSCEILIEPRVLLADEPDMN